MEEAVCTGALTACSVCAAAGRAQAPRGNCPGKQNNKYEDNEYYDMMKIIQSCDFKISCGTRFAGILVGPQSI